MTLNELIDELTKELGKLKEATKPKAPTSAPLTVKPMSAMTPEEKVQLDLTVHPGSARRAIAKRLGLTPSEASYLLKGMAKKALVARVGNRRASRWYLMQTLKDIQRPH